MHYIIIIQLSYHTISNLTRFNTNEKVINNHFHFNISIFKSKKKQRRKKSFFQLQNTQKSVHNG